MLEALKNSPVKFGIAIGAVILLNIVGWFLYFTWQSPLGEPLDVPTATQNQSTATEVVATAAPTDTPRPEETQSPTNTPEPTLTPTIEPVCGGPPVMNVLVAGVASDGYLFGLADAVRLVRIDFQQQKVDVLALPRDLWVDIPNISDHGVTEGKLNQAYFYGTEGMGFYDGPGYGSGLLAHTLQQNFGVHVDHYIAVNHYGFRNIVDAIGGIDVCFSEPVYTKWFGEPKLFKKEGCHTLDGREAEKVVRARIEIGDYGRIQRQTHILRAVAAKMLTPSGIRNLPDFVNRLRNYVQTDLSPQQGSTLICLAEKIDASEDINYHVIPQDILTEERIMDEFQGYEVYAFTYDEGEIRDIITRFQNGTLGE